MKFDDRLATALRIGASGPAMARIELRQLLDLLGASPAHLRSQAVEAGYARIAELSQQIPPGVRAAIVREPGLRLRSARLVALLATSEYDVAEAAIDRASLTTEEWQDLVPAIPPAARRALRQRADLAPEVLRRLNDAGAYDRGLPAGPAEAANAEPAPKPEPASAVPATLRQNEPESGTIGALVRRIEAYRQARQAAAPVAMTGSADDPRLPLDEDHDPAQQRRVSVIDFATGPTGAIVWADSPAAPMMIGFSPFGTGAMEAAYKHRRPMAAQPLELGGGGASAGAWQLDAAPRFAPQTGAFLGFAGRLRRVAGEAASAPPCTRQRSRPDPAIAARAAHAGKCDSRFCRGDPAAAVWPHTARISRASSQYCRRCRPHARSL